MTRLFDPPEEDPLETAEAEKDSHPLSQSLYSVEHSPSEARNARQWIKRARDKKVLKSLENPFEDDQDIMNYLDRAIDNARNPLDQLELKMLHESLCKEIHREKRQKRKAPTTTTSQKV
jgi:hypothetical protein